MAGGIRAIIAALALSVCGLEAAQAGAPPAATDFARYAAIEQVSISPDGAHIVGLTSPNGKDRTISIWRTDAPNQPPTVLGSVPQLRLQTVEFLKNDRLAVVASQTFSFGSLKTHLFKLFITDLKGSRWVEPLERVERSEDGRFLRSVNQPQILSTMPGDPKHIIVAEPNDEGHGDVYRVDVYSGAAARIDRATDQYFSPIVDQKGVIRAKQRGDSEGGRYFIALFLRHPDTGALQEHFRSYAADRTIADVVGFTNDPNLIYLKIASKSEDKAGVVVYDIRQRKILETEFKHKFFEAGGAIQSTDPKDLGALLGFTYAAESSKVFWTDPTMKARFQGVEKALAVKTVSTSWTDIATGETASIATMDGARVNFVSASQDRSRIIVSKSGSKQPAEYYLLAADGTLTLLGKSRGWIDAASLGDTRLVQYKARDGLIIPAFLTTPPAAYGAGPHPAIILPHGGPWARDDQDWDSSGWVQYFAARGYVVLQPQFRGSDGWGQKLWRAGDGEWGQKMQDDKDDGAKWLIAQKYAAPDRVAMFGYSYGGYAALAAAIRPNGLYQCAISGAGAGDLASLQRLTFDNRFLREYQNPSMKGMDPLDRAREAQIPLFIYHGDRDQTVEVKQSRRFVDVLKGAGKPHRYIEIKDMGHSYTTMTPDMLALQLVEIERYLKTECGPAGL